MPWPVPCSPPCGQASWRHRHGPTVFGPHTVVTVFAAAPPPPPAPAPRVTPALRQRIEYARLFEDGHCPPAPPTAAALRRAVERYAAAAVSPAWAPSGWLRRR